MTALDILDDAVKIGFGSLAGWLIARGSRSHDFEKERRRRKQDCLERAVEDFDQFYYALQYLASASMAFAEASPTSKLSVHDEVIHAVKKEDAARVGFCRNRSKLMIFGFLECAKAVTNYEAEALTIKAALLRLRGGEKIDYHDIIIEPEGKAQEFRNAVAEAFKRL